MKTIEETLKSLEADEEEAIEGYKKALELHPSENMELSFKQILIEEEAHRAYLREAMKNPDALYRSFAAEDPEVQAEAIEGSYEPEWME